MTPCWRAAGSLIVLTALGAAAARAEELSGLQWLERMNRALAQRNYDGIFFHVRDGRVETLRIIHSVRDNEVKERLVALDGSRREFIRSGDELVCYLPDRRTVLVERRPKDSSLLGTLPRFDEAAAASYEIRTPQRARLMGRDARLVEILPRDEFRFGYRLWIDEATAMPLKTQLCDPDGRVLEQLVFARLTLPAYIGDEHFKPQIAVDGFRWIRPQVAAAPADSSGESQLWHVMQLPPGFRLTSRATQHLPGAKAPATHLVYSDGLATVSVFVESADAAVAAAPSAEQIGVSSAFRTRIGGRQITAVGEVPMVTARYFATQLRALVPGGEAAGVAYGPREPLSLQSKQRRPAGTVPALAPATPRR
ncbi:MAG: MucB/RseB C-terminal domain-containing protein [Steroidobacteraceae bacterium]|nr:MucB/RseB C-terminal domain-containing protein [Steroidobacteraceae bacterium]MDW8259083.1 MucB/RseB C-terminal domain-containing protein [Gammaproteobacteria bacterium]